MENKKILIIGNKPYYNFKLNNIVDSFDVIYRFNFAWPGKNSGTKFGKLVMCGHMYHNFVTNLCTKEQIVPKYGHELHAAFLNDWYDFFKENKQHFDEIFYENEKNWREWNNMLEKYGCPHRFSKMASSGYSVIFRKLTEGGEVYVSGFTLCNDEIRKTMGETDQIAIAKHHGAGSHSFSDEKRILAWLHNNKKIDASLCMLEDTDELSLETNEYNTEPSEFILNLLNREQETI